ncbi:MAG: tRNA uridine-5-carboxymethylaminomethyl(34) synthesis GTPase MnmE [Candidatus Babeliaceae bacterium]
MTYVLTSDDEQTIIALCTPRGNGALALLRLTGNNAWVIAQSISKLPGNKLLGEQQSHTVHYGWIIDRDHQPIDQVMFIMMRGPKTFTGQDTVEITCHNNPFIIEAIIERAITEGARPAQEGEFSRRAFMNGKIDLIQAEAIHELINAQTQMALKRTLAQLEGSFSHWVTTVEQELIKIFAWCQASFEFLDEELEFADRMREALKKIVQNIKMVKKTINQQQQIRQGVRIVLIGSVNAGKSSLFNALLNQKRAIVTAQAGTTRDTIEAGVYRHGAYWTLIDTAGLRQTADVIEQEGIKRSYEEAQKADIILLVIDTTRALMGEEQEVYQKVYDDFSHKIIVVYHKTDMQQNHKSKSLTFQKNTPLLAVSSLTGVGCDQLEQALEIKINELCAAADAPFLLTQRQIKLLQGFEQKLEEIDVLLSQSAQYEIIAYHLQDALEHMSELTGKTISESAMDAVFKEFCVGK